MNSSKENVSSFNERMDCILQYMHEGLIILDEKNLITKVNDALLKIFCFSNHQEVVGRNMAELFADRNEINALNALHQQNPVLKQENIFSKANGKKFPGQYTITLFQDPDNGAWEKIILLSDVTTSRHCREQLVKSVEDLRKNNEELDQFSYIISHDLKAPLRAISNLSTWLQEDLGTSITEDGSKNLELLRGRVTRMESLIDGVLEYSRVGRQKISYETVDVSLLLQEIKQHLAPEAHVTISIAEHMPVFTTFRIFLFQVFSNLIDNAIKYNDKKNPVIKISASDQGDMYVFTVEDNGPGIAPEYHEKIFKIFQTLQPRDTVESTGVGLTIVKRILEAQEGRIHVESEVGGGSRFIFHWPKKIIQVSEKN